MKRLTYLLCLVFLVGSVGLAATETLYAVPMYSAEIPGVATVNDSPSPVSLTSYFQMNDVDAGGNFVGVKTHGADAAASYGQGRGSTFADYLNSREFFPISIVVNGAQESSMFFLDDLEITGPPGNILVSFNFVISGGLIATDSGGAFMSSAASVDADLSIGSSFGAIGGMNLGHMDVGSAGNVARTGIFSTFPVDSDGLVTGMTASILTFASDPDLRFGLGLDTSAIVEVGLGAVFGVAYSSSSFTFGFPTSGPVANLPPGYTLNSPDGHIVDNHFVPEPPSVVLLIAGLLVLALKQTAGSWFPRRRTL